MSLVEFQAPSTGFTDCESLLFFIFEISRCFINGTALQFIGHYSVALIGGKISSPCLEKITCLKAMGLVIRMVERQSLL